MFCGPHTVSHALSSFDTRCLDESTILARRPRRVGRAVVPLRGFVSRAGRKGAVCARTRHRRSRVSRLDGCKVICPAPPRVDAGSKLRLPLAVVLALATRRRWCGLCLLLTLSSAHSAVLAAPNTARQPAMAGESSRPKSRFVPDAHMTRAEYVFTKAAPDYAVAFREYEQVLQHRGTSLYDLALFKNAWTLWRLGRPDQAAQRFLRVFRATAVHG